MLVASGGSYDEESTGSTVALGASDEVRSIVEMGDSSGESVEVSITPVSEMAVARFENLRDSLDSAGGSTASHEELDKVIAPLLPKS